MSWWSPGDVLVYIGHIQICAPTITKYRTPVHRLPWSSGHDFRLSFILAMRSAGDVRIHPPNIGIYRANFLLAGFDS